MTKRERMHELLWVERFLKHIERECRFRNSMDREELESLASQTCSERKRLTAVLLDMKED